MANLIEKVRQYSNANGGHATNAATSGVTAAHFIDVVSGRRRVSRQVAVAMAPLVGVTVNQLLNENSDIQLVLMRGALA